MIISFAVLPNGGCFIGASRFTYCVILLKELHCRKTDMISKNISNCFLFFFPFFLSFFICDEEGFSKMAKISD